MKPKPLAFFVLAAVLVVFLCVQGFNSKDIKSTVLKDNTRPLSPEKYQEALAHFMSILEKENPRVALDAFRQEMKENPSLGRDCHSIVHSIGNAAYTKYKDFAQAAEYQDEICNSGYIHGVIEGNMGERGEADVSAIADMCGSSAPISFRSFECFHGLGHGFMYYTDNDLAKSTALCESLPNSLSQENCVNGTLMENFNTGEGHKTEYVRPQDPFYPCQKIDSKYKTSCYFYSAAYFLSLHDDDYFKAMDWCRGAEADRYALVCMGGVGGQAMKENINNPLFVETLYDQLPEDVKKVKDIHTAYFSGATSMYINHFGSLKPAIDFCNALKTENQSDCRDVIGSMSKMF